MILSPILYLQSRIFTMPTYALYSIHDDDILLLSLLNSIASLAAAYTSRFLQRPCNKPINDNLRSCILRNHNIMMMNMCRFLLRKYHKDLLKLKSNGFSSLLFPCEW